MALDIYVGTMTRYYRHEWENIGQRISREQGIEYQIIRPEGTVPPPGADEIRGAVKEWCNHFSANLAKEGVGTVDWSEVDDEPYFTDRPGWEGHNALLVWAAHAEHPKLPLPAETPDFTKDRAYALSTSETFQSRFEAILLAELWLPCEFSSVVLTENMTGKKLCVASTFALKSQLDELYALTASRLPKPDAEPLPERFTTPKDSFLDRLFKKKPSPVVVEKAVNPPLLEAASINLAMFRKLAAHACEHRLPMLLDY